MKPSLLWLRRDLRLLDHPALCAAAEDGAVIPVFILDPALLEGRWPSPNRVHFMLESVKALSRQLQELGSHLVVRRGPPKEVLAGLLAETGCGRIHYQRDYGPYARQRDATITGVAHPGQLIHEPEVVLTVAGQPYSVFTPYRRRWEQLGRREVLAAPARLKTPDRWPSSDPLPPTESISQLLEAGETAARRRLDHFSQHAVLDYAARRDRPGCQGTSRLSQDLRWGLLSPLEVAERCAGSDTYVSELCWRDFYYHILWHHPRVTRQAYRPALDKVAWERAPEHLRAWKEGRTGYPIVDAAMRELKATGWMHNRSRMIVASFLTKDLLIDWREGERHFMEYLVDGDLAANNGGWQWAASTGTDPQPYFRIFNPVLQGQKFDPEGEYVRAWVSELARVPKKYVHEPHKMPSELQETVGCRIGHEYPAPIVDHAQARDLALRAYERALGK